MSQPPRHAEPRDSEPTPVRVPEGAPTWVTAELVDQTIQTWQPYYEHPLTSEDALAIIQVGGRLLELLTRGSVP